MHSTEQDTGGGSPVGYLARAALCMQQRRHADAVDLYKQALALDPNLGDAYAGLAQCWLQIPGMENQGVEAARQAVAREPERAAYRGILAMALQNTAKPGQEGVLKQALVEAEEAVALDPDSGFSYVVMARVLLSLRRHAEAEKAARYALQLDTEDTWAAEILSAALLMQRKDGDNKDLIDYHLQRNPDDDAAHSSAGWQALMRGDHKQANVHFREALRLNPMSEGARMGLVESYRARSWPYRLLLRFSHFMNQFTEGKQTMIFLGGFVFYRVAYASLKTTAPAAAYAVVALWLTFVFWGYLARGLSGFFMLFDRWARLSLRPKELWEAAVVGGFTVLSAVMFGLLLAGVGPIPTFVVFALGFAAISNAVFFVNEHHLGKFAYGAVAVGCGGAALYALASTAIPNGLPGAELAASGCILAGVLVTWLASFGVLKA